MLATRRASAARRLRIYANAYRLRLAEVLGNDYPGLAARLGEERFARIVRAYIAAHPSRHTNLRWYGAGLARFLQHSSRGRDRQALAELAQFEWALGLAFDAADAPLLEVDRLAIVPPADWPALRFVLQPSVQLLVLHSNAPQVWRTARAGGRKIAMSPRRTAVSWIVWRKGFEPCYRVLEADEAWALRAVKHGRDFAQICSGLRRFAGGEHAAQRGAQLLRNWLAEGLLSAAALTSRAGSQGRRRTSRTRRRGARAGA